MFGGLEGLEAGVDVDPNLEVTDPSVLFDFYLNTCPSQGSRTIRTEVGLIMWWGTMPVCTGQCCVSASGGDTGGPRAVPHGDTSAESGGLPSAPQRAAVLTAACSVPGSDADLSVCAETPH